MPITKICKCGKKFESRITGVSGKRSQQRFCSLTCSSRFSKPTREVKCVDCQQVFIYHGRGRCSRCKSCAKTHSEKRIAAWQASHRTKNPGVGSGGAQWGADNHQWLGGVAKPKYKGNYRLRCFKAWNCCCVVCGDTPVEAHHIDGDEDNYLAINLVPLCHKHHWRVHGKRKLSSEQMKARLFDIWPEGRIKIAELSEKLSNETTRTEGQPEVDQGQRIAGEKI